MTHPMLHASNPLLWWSGWTLATLGVVYSAIALVALLVRRRPAAARAACLRPVTLLKPLCGLESGLYECLRSFCLQRYPSAVQLVFGVAKANDPAAAIVRRLRRDFPALDIVLVVDGTAHGSNPKVSNLINMMNHAAHDWLVLADSDIRVAPDYLERVAAPLADGRVGIVTCAYTGRAERGIWSRLGVEFIRGWFTPSVFVSDFLGSREFAFGATIALRRNVLESSGGLRAIVDHLADDYRLGESVRALGLETVLSDVLVETTVSESSFRTLASHQLRWMRTIRGVRPIGYVLAGVTFSFPLALLGWVSSRFEPGVAALTLLVLLLRCAISVTLSTTSRPRELARLPLVPLSDLLAFGLWCAGFLSRQVVWRSDAFTVDRDGLAFPVKQSRQTLPTGETL